MSTLEKPLRADAERNRARILEAAGELFAQRGLGVTLNDVAHHAGVGVGTVYRRFPDKELLIDALFQERVEALAAVVHAGLEDEDPWRGLVDAVAGMLALQEADSGLKELLLCGDRDRGRDGVLGVRERIAPLIGELVARAKDAGVLRADIEHRDVVILQVMLGAVIDCSREAAPGLWRRYLEIMLQGFRADTDAPPLTVPVPDMEQMDRVMHSWRPPQRG